MQKKTMKKTLIIMCSIFMLACTKESPIQVTDQPDIQFKSKPKPPWWTTILPPIDIRFGTNKVVYGPNGPMPMECIDGGLCRITVGSSVGEITGEAKGNLFEHDGHAYIAFINSTLTPSELNTYFQGDTFVVEKE
jgi:hypothetical protein